MRPEDPAKQPRAARKALHTSLLLALAATLGALLAGCGGDGTPAPAKPGPPDDPAPAYVERGDLDALKQRGRLRILLPQREVAMLDRRGSSLDGEIELARQLSSRLGLSPELLFVRDRAELIEQLVAGHGDLVIARLTVTPERAKRVDFTTPVDHVREMLVLPAGAPAPKELGELAGLRIAVRETSSYYATLARLRETVPIEIETVPETTATEELIYRVARGELAATVADEDLLEAVLSYQDGIQAALPLSEPRPVAWALRLGRPALRESINTFLHERALIGERHRPRFGDLEEIKRRGVLRVLTRNNAACYFLYRGEERGFELELVREFAKRLGVRLQVILPPDGSELLPWLLEGRGDLVASSMTITPERAAWVDFTRPYLEPDERLVVHAEREEITGLAGLRGRTVTVRRGSSYHQSLLPLAEEHGFTIDFAPADTETEEILAMVAAGELEATVADSHILGIELALGAPLRDVTHVAAEQQIGWAVRDEDGGLLDAANAYLEDIDRGTFYNILRRRYFRDDRRLKRVLPERAKSRAALSPFDPLFRTHGRLRGLDWRLLAAQAYQESRFDPAAKSWAGAVGLMQVMPRAAQDVGLEGDLRDPGFSVAVGSAYLRKLVDRTEDTLPLAERLRFGLASYNVGRGHVEDGRRLAAELGLDPNRWFDNVEKALPYLRQRKYAARARYGYCRCSEPIRYVAEINERYAAYARLVDVGTTENDQAR